MPLPKATPALLRQLAQRYNTPGFIAADPVQFPHRYTAKTDIEISAFVTAWISWGNRKQIVSTAQRLHTDIFGNDPTGYLQSREWERYRGSTDCFYRTVRFGDFCQLMERLHSVYSQHADLEDCVVANLAACGGDPAQALGSVFSGIAGIADPCKKSPCKRLWLFLRWMVRRDGIVDLGVWRRLQPAQLVIPLDTHVHHTALMLGVTTRHTADITTARQITDRFRTIFPDDPALGDFALFGYGMENGI